MAHTINFIALIKKCMTIVVPRENTVKLERSNYKVIFNITKRFSLLLNIYSKHKN